MSDRKIVYKAVREPGKDCALPVELTDETMEERRREVLARMREKGLDKLIVYCDVEHYGNFYYLIGFYTRFEEALLVIDKDGSMTLMLGNENLNHYCKARMKCNAVHVSLFSLPNQPNRNDKSFEDLLLEAGLGEGQSVGIAGWKNFTSEADDGKNMYDIPAYMVESIRSVIGQEGRLSNQTALYIGENGVRTTNNANEIAHYEYGAALASDAMLDAMNLLDEGISELALGDRLSRYGQRSSVTTIAASGERFVKGNIFPTQRQVKLGDPISLTVGYMGGTSSRAGYAVHIQEELPEGAEHYMEELAIPYFRAYAAWMEEIRIGMPGGRMYEIIEKILPKAEYHWKLCPGHLTAEEEWLSSPIYAGSVEELKSGMIFQIDIIPCKSGMKGVSAESTVVLADKRLQKDIRENYPDLWERMMRRKNYIREELRIHIADELFPLCSTAAYLRPYLLNKTYALAVSEQ